MLKPYQQFVLRHAYAFRLISTFNQGPRVYIDEPNFEFDFSLILLTKNKMYVSIIYFSSADTIMNQPQHKNISHKLVNLFMRRNMG